MLNKVILMGRLTRDPETRATQTGTTVVTFSIAIDRTFQKQGEERQADFINCVSFNNTAEFIKKFFSKGRMICVVGSIQTRTWEGQDGRKNYVTEVIVNEANFTGEPKDYNGSQSQGNGSSHSNAQGTSASQDDGFISVGEEDQLPF